ncbi:MAG: GGDEF domain-containing protein [Candidatus Saccharicenans sp.]
MDKVKLHPLKLSFPHPEIERKFLENYHQKNLPRLRVAIILGLFLYSIFAILDSLSVGPLWPKIWFIRFAVIDPFLILMLGATFFFKKQIIRYYQPFVSFIILMAGFGILAMLAIIPAPAQYLYSQGLMLVLIYNYAFLGLRFIYASFNYFLIIVAFEITSTKINPLPAYAFINNNFFLISASIIGMAVSYYLERLNRENFIHSVSLRKMAEVDSLTDVLNRKFFMEEVEEKLSRLPGFNGNSAFCLLDLDGFKEINDQLGHVTGDEVLRNFGQAIVKKMRSTDFIGRVGGDEFGFFFEQIKNLEDLYSIFRKIKEEYYNLNQKVLKPVTFSVGCVLLNTPSCEFLSVYTLADKALLQVKQKKNSIKIIDTEEKILLEKMFN